MNPLRGVWHNSLKSPFHASRTQQFRVTKTEDGRPLFEQIVKINRDREITILLVEQNANLALEVSHRGYVLETGRVILEGAAKQLRADPKVREAYLGG